MYTNGRIEKTMRPVLYKGTEILIFQLFKHGMGKQSNIILKIQYI